MNRLQGILGGIVEGAGQLAQWLCLVLVLLVAGNVLVRYFLDTGTVALQELEWHLISPIALFGMAYALRHDAHVRVDVLYEHYPPRLRAAIDLLSALLMAGFALYIARLSLPYVGQAYRIGEGSPDPGGLPYRFLLKACITAGFVLLAVQAVAALLALMTRRTGGASDDTMGGASHGR